VQHIGVATNSALDENWAAAAALIHSELGIRVNTMVLADTLVISIVAIEFAKAAR
jgi:hypothetical protein